MRPDVERLHVAARRYCGTRHFVWSREYVERRAGGQLEPVHASEAYRDFPRYHLLAAIRADLEQLTGVDVGDLDDARELFALAGFTADEDWGHFRRYTHPGAEAADQEERDAFASFVRGISIAELDAVEPLPFARVLPRAEAMRWWTLLEQTWGFNSDKCWYPIIAGARPGVTAFQRRGFEAIFTPERIQAILRRRGLSRVWELREFGPEYERDVEGLEEPYYTSAECVCTSPSLDWVLYASHESSITIGGWLLDEVMEAWPEWRDHLWTTPFYA